MPFSPYSNIATATTANLVAPSNLNATAISDDRIDLTWDDNSSGETSHRIERSPNGVTGWVEVASVGANVENYSDTGLDPSTLYHYRTRAAIGPDFSAYSNVDSETTAAAGFDPAAEADVMWWFETRSIPVQGDNTDLVSWPEDSALTLDMQFPGTQGGDQPKFRTTGFTDSLGDVPSVEFDGNDQGDIPFPNFSPKLEDKSCTFYWVLDYQVNSQTLGVLLFNFVTGGSDAISMWAAANTVFFTDPDTVGYEYNVGAGASDRDLAAAVNGKQLLVFKFDKTAGLASLYRNGTLVGTNANVGGTGAGNGFDFGQDFIEFFATGGGSLGFVGRCGVAGGFSSAHDDTKRAQFEAYINARYLV